MLCDTDSHDFRELLDAATDAVGGLEMWSMGANRLRAAIERFPPLPPKPFLRADGSLAEAASLTDSLGKIPYGYYAGGTAGCVGRSLPDYGGLSGLGVTSGRA